MADSALSPPPPLCSHSPSPGFSVPSSLAKVLPSSPPPVPLPGPQREAWIAYNPNAPTQLPSARQLQDRPNKLGRWKREGKNAPLRPCAAAQGAEPLHGHQRARAPSLSRNHDGDGGWPSGPSKGCGVGGAITPGSTRPKCSPTLDEDSDSVRQGPRMQSLDFHPGRAPRFGLQLTVCAPPPGRRKQCGLAELGRRGWEPRRRLRRIYLEAESGERVWSGSTVY